MVSSRRMLVINEIMSRLAIKQSKFCWRISLNTGTKNLAILYMGVPMAERTGRKTGKPSIALLWTFAFKKVF